MLKKPEILAPAGNFEKLKIAYKFGADAAYVGGTALSLRMASGNFTFNELERAVDLANSNSKKLYLVVNIKAHSEDTKILADYLTRINKIKPHALIIADAGVFKMARELTDIDLHISTQSSVTNRLTCKFWKDSGAKRVILAREVSLNEIMNLKNHEDTKDLEVEAFIHGAMCIGYSGKCVISNHISNRDANRGGCIQNCRYNYEIYDEEMNLNASSFFMSSKDLMSIRLLPNFISSKTDSLKIEGRMKSNMYVANTVSTYRDALDTFYEAIQAGKDINEIDPTPWERELSKVSNRTFSTGNLEKRAAGESIRSNCGDYIRKIEFIGTVQDVNKGKGIAIEAKASFKVGETVEFHNPNGSKVDITISNLLDINGKQIEKSQPSTLVVIPYTENIEILSVVRKPMIQNGGKA
jgi:putative protease